MPRSRLHTSHKGEDASLIHALCFPVNSSCLCSCTVGLCSRMIDLCFYMVGKVLRWSFQYISLIFVGVTLDQMEKLVKDKNEQEWSELKGRLADRTANINILSGLAVAASATYLVSNSPTDFADWNHQFPYFFIAGANGSAMLSVLSGLGLLIILNMMNLNSFRVSVALSYSIFLLIPIALATTNNHRRCRSGGSVTCSFSYY
ncbi:hypothetical protein BKA83DRAFT_4234121 [Pisolithus microcarpus]|nr:hypothetical protein BKA83DRAFT_4341989 [Pisolithus microcarpus]KAI6027818.1 hypothetical protein BKA83DRAFT_4234121 [Pisolithus microcarpus]